MEWRLPPFRVVLLVVATSISSCTAFSFSCPQKFQIGSIIYPRTTLLKSKENVDNEYHEKPNESAFTRRSVMETSGKSLASLLLAPSVLASSSVTNAASEPPVYADTKRTILLTGCNSGIGYDAAKRLAQRGHDIILACRTLEKATGAANQIKEELGTALTGNLLPKECNLADLTSIASLVQELNTNGTKLDSLCLNAGIARNTATKEVLFTSQGFELTIGTNHLGHFYLTNMLLPLLKTDGMGSNIVVTASGVHDPDSPGGAQGSLATLGDLAGLEKSVKENVSFDMVDGNAFDPDKAYKDSKLCNVFFTRELQRRLDASNKNIKVNCFNPGLIVSTGLFRDQNPLFTKVFDFVATDLFKVGETPHWGGGALEYMTLSDRVASKGGMYYTSPPGSSKYGDAAFGAQFSESEVSIEARDNAKGKQLWELSEKLVGIST